LHIIASLTVTFANESGKGRSSISKSRSHIGVIIY
jgi:hypothetical protein